MTDATTRVLSARELSAERRLVEKSQRDPRHFAPLYERYFDRIYAFALVRTGNRTAAEDVTAETFRRALQNLARFEWRGVPLSAWLFRIAANVAIDLQARSTRETTLDELTDDATESWESHFIEVEERSELFALVRRLGGDEQKVIVMRFAEEKSTGEIALALGRTEGAVKALQHRALTRLRQWAVEP